MTNRGNLSSVFISQVKILFDVLDENQSGFVRLGDIESHWGGNDCIIPGNIVVQSLRNVASPSRRLSFDMLIVGLERALDSWKNNSIDTNCVITHTNEKRRSSPVDRSSGTTTYKPVSIKSVKNCAESVALQTCAHSAAWNGLTIPSAAEYTSGSVTLGTEADDFRRRRHERTLAGHSQECAPVRKREGNQSVELTSLV